MSFIRRFFQGMIPTAKERAHLDYWAFRRNFDVELQKKMTPGHRVNIEITQKSIALGKSLIDPKPIVQHMADRNRFNLELVNAHAWIDYSIEPGNVINFHTAVIPWDYLRKTKVDPIKLLSEACLNYAVERNYIIKLNCRTLQHYVFNHQNPEWNKRLEKGSKLTTSA